MGRLSVHWPVRAGGSGTGLPSVSGRLVPMMWGGARRPQFKSVTRFREEPFGSQYTTYLYTKMPAPVFGGGPRLPCPGGRMGALESGAKDLVAMAARVTMAVAEVTDPPLVAMAARMTVAMATAAMAMAPAIAPMGMAVAAAMHIDDDAGKSFADRP